MNSTTVKLSLNDKEFTLKYGLKTWRKILEVYPDISDIDSLNPADRILLLVKSALPVEELPAGFDDSTLEDWIDDSDPEQFAQIISAWTSSIGFLGVSLKGAADAVIAVSEKPKQKK
jgi:hypothetical protein